MIFSSEWHPKTILMNIVISIVPENHSNEHSFIHFNVLLTSLVMRKSQNWPKMPFAAQNMTIFDQKLWWEQSNDTFNGMALNVQTNIVKSILMQCKLSLFTYSSLYNTIYHLMARRPQQAEGGWVDNNHPKILPVPVPLMSGQIAATMESRKFSKNFPKYRHGYSKLCIGSLEIVKWATRKSEVTHRLALTLTALWTWDMVAEVVPVHLYTM